MPAVGPDLPGQTKRLSPVTGKDGAPSSSPVSTPSTVVDEHEQDFRHSVTDLARRASRQKDLAVGNPFVRSGEGDPRLDPTSPSFDPDSWVAAVVRTQTEEGVPLRSAGVAWNNLTVRGQSTGAEYQQTVANAPLALLESAVHSLYNRNQKKVDILKSMAGLAKPGEAVVVLGPPGSGCSTFLKTIAGETHGVYVDPESVINHQGIKNKDMRTTFKGDAIYSSELDIHLPHLSVGQTLSFAAEARAPRQPLGGLTRAEYADFMRDVAMATFGISHTVNTKVGNDFVRGVSGGERKRVSVAEVFLSGASLQCWDNSTRGLDSANAISFCRTIRRSTRISNATAFVAIYQAPAEAYECFDKALVLYQGECIYFGSANEAKQYFIDLGFHCPERQVVPDFLTSMSSPAERRVREGFEGRVPKTPAEFAAAYRNSLVAKTVQQEIGSYNAKYPIDSQDLQGEFACARRVQKAKWSRDKSPWTLSYAQQVKLCLKRGFWRLKGDPEVTLTQLFGNGIIVLLISLLFRSLPTTTGSFFARSAVIFLAVVLNAFSAALEILTLYATRSVTEKHARFALYRPSAEAFAAMLVDMPYKIANSLITNNLLYWIVGLRPSAGHFFFYLFVAFSTMLSMSMLYRTIGAASRSLSQAMIPSATLMLALVLYAGFEVPIPYMKGWISWFRYVNPVYYGLSAIMINEYGGRDFACSEIVPSGGAYDAIGGLGRSCSAVGATTGSLVVNGTAYLRANYGYIVSEKWRNAGLLWVFIFGLATTYLIFSDLISELPSKGEVLVFKRNRKANPVVAAANTPADPEKGDAKPLGRSGEKSSAGTAGIVRQTAIFHWEDMCYDIKIKKEERRILDHVDGWIVPGTVTALMGVSGAGKTTLLDVLATRVTMGVVSGEALVDGRPRDTSFARKSGYVQQQDLHLSTTTVREALAFSALLRQPAHIAKADKLAYVDEVIELLDMQEYADSVVGVRGVGLNVEQRKRLTIGVELAAKPELLLFLDEPTSGLDSQTSWAIMDLLEKLANAGQAILCTIHQPSAMLFSRFDRLLFLGKGGRTIYFGDIGKNSSTLLDYFSRNGANPIDPAANPAEYMFSVGGPVTDWHQVWLDSPERAAVKAHLAHLKKTLSAKPRAESQDKRSLEEFAAPISQQGVIVGKRFFQQLWRTPDYIWSKLVLCAIIGLFIGFSFINADSSRQGLLNQIFAIFTVTLIFEQLTQTLMPSFVEQRDLYESRERASRTYSWKVFVLANIVGEIPWSFISAIILLPFYYIVGLHRNGDATDDTHERGLLFFLNLFAFVMLASTTSQLFVAPLGSAETASNLALLCFFLWFLFLGVLAPPSLMEGGFYVFLYRLNPLTYWVSSIISAGLGRIPVQCSDTEITTVVAPAGQTCAMYLGDYVSQNNGYIVNPAASGDCQYCPIATSDEFLSGFGIVWEQRWRDFGIQWSFIIFNIFGAVFLYWLFRVPKKGGVQKKGTKGA